jgi:TrmH family RNA methyltransferase
MHENKYPLVTHSRDPRFLTLRSLRNPQVRNNTGDYLIEGIRHVAKAVESRVVIQSLFIEPSLLTNRFAQKLARKLRKSGIPGVRLSSPLYGALTLAAEPQGIGAVLKQRWCRLADAEVKRHSLWLAIESVDFPGNLGTMIRTAEAAGVAGIFLLRSIGDHSVPDPWDPAAVRATMGSLFSQKLVCCSTDEFVAWARAAGVTLVGSSPRGLLDYKGMRYREPKVLLIGSERHGLSEQLIDACDFLVRIPMRGACDSINAAVAAGVLLFEMSHR